MLKNLGKEELKNISGIATVLKDAEIILSYNVIAVTNGKIFCAFCHNEKYWEHDLHQISVSREDLSKYINGEVDSFPKNKPQTPYVNIDYMFFQFKQFPKVEKSQYRMTDFEHEFFKIVGGMHVDHFIVSEKDFSYKVNLHFDNIHKQFYYDENFVYGFRK